MSGDDTGDSSADTEPGTGTGPELDDDDLADQYPPGPSDHGRTGGMATRESAPDVADGSGPATEPTG